MINSSITWKRLSVVQQLFVLIQCKNIQTDVTGQWADPKDKADTVLKNLVLLKASKHQLKKFYLLTIKGTSKTI